MNHQLHFRREYMKCKYQGATSDTSNFNQGRRCYYFKIIFLRCVEIRGMLHGMIVSELCPKVFSG